MRKIRVLVVDDSHFMRTLISHFIEDDPELEVIGKARNGQEAVGLVQALKPDVVTMDVEMPVMDGLQALEQIMREHPVPVLMVSSLTQKGAETTMQALEKGAVDFIGKPSGSLSVDLHKVKEELIRKIKSAASSRPSPHTTPMPAEKPAALPRPAASVLEPRRQIVAIGTSTGGPRALDAVLSAMPGDFPFPILVVQHMPPAFTASLARRLDRQSPLKVVEAEHLQQVEGGVVYIAPGGKHMQVVEDETGCRIYLNQFPPVNGHRPSVDVLFDSVGLLKRYRRHLVIMTGMGSDGAKGMLAAKQRGAETTIAQSEETCVVFGMPKAAIALGCVDQVVPLPQIAAAILKATGYLS